MTIYNLLIFINDVYRVLIFTIKKFSIFVVANLQFLKACKMKFCNSKNIVFICFDFQVKEKRHICFA